MLKNRCYNGGNKHNYQPVYSEEKIDDHITIRNMFANDIRKLIILNKYVCSICKWCGKIIK